MQFKKVPDVVFDDDDETDWDQPFDMTPDKIEALTQEMDKIDAIARQHRLALPIERRLNVLVTRGPVAAPESPPAPHRSRSKQRARGPRANNR